MKLYFLVFADLGIHGGKRVSFVLVWTDQELSVRSLLHGVIENSSYRISSERIIRGPAHVAVLRPVIIPRKSMMTAENSKRQ